MGRRLRQEADASNGALKLLFGDDLEAARRIQLADGKFLLDDARLARGLARIGELVAEDGDLGAGAPKPEMPRTSAEAQAEINAVRAAAYENPKHAYNDQRHPEHEALHARVRDLYRIAQGDAR